MKPRTTPIRATGGRCHEARPDFESPNTARCVIDRRRGHAGGDDPEHAFRGRSSAAVPRRRRRRPWRSASMRLAPKVLLAPCVLTCALVLALHVGPASAATITIVDLDGPGEGFNDTTPVDPVGGNPGTT